MMPNMRDAIRGLGRRVSVKVITQQVVDREAVQRPVDRLRASLVLVPMPAQKINIKPEGQRTWKWWTGTSSVKLELGWFCKADGDGGKLYEVMEEEDWGQARVYVYSFAESPRT